MSFIRAAVLGLAAIVMVAGISWAAQPRAPLDEGPTWEIKNGVRRSRLPDPKQYPWQDEAARVGLDEKTIEALGKQKVLVTAESFKQVFDPYLQPKGMPFFITSDSILNAFHVLYEESVMRMERVQARGLPGHLRFLWAGLDAQVGDEKHLTPLEKSAKKRAQIILGTALALAGDTTVKPPPDVAAIIAKEVEKVTAAAAHEKPAWLGPKGDPELLEVDYTRYKPRGFYTRSPDLERYFRAVSWLQSIPLRVSKDEELLAVMMISWPLVDSAGAHAAECRACGEFLSTYRQLVGVGDDWDLAKAAMVANLLRVGVNFHEEPGIREADLPAVRKEIEKQASRWIDVPMINDQVRLPPAATPGRVPASEPNFRIVSAYRTPDAVLFHRTTDLRTFGDRPLPTGLEVAAALGSEFARRTWRAATATCSLRPSMIPNRSSGALRSIRTTCSAWRRCSRSPTRRPPPSCRATPGKPSRARPPWAAGPNSGTPGRSRPSET